MNKFGPFFRFLSIVSVPCWFSLVSNSVSQAEQSVPWPDQPLVLTDEIKAYVSGAHDPSASKVRPGHNIRVVYLGYSENEIAENFSGFPAPQEFNITHLPYGRSEYYSLPIDPLDYQAPDTITVLAPGFNDPQTKAVSPGDDVSEKLDPKSGYIHNLGSSLFQIMKIAMGGGTVTELGPPMKDFAKAEFTYRESLFDESCTSVFEFVELENGKQHNTMIVFSGHAPGSAEQIACLARHALIFMRPTSFAFDYPGSRN
jgi:hypothetical protein